MEGQLISAKTGKIIGDPPAPREPTPDELRAQAKASRAHAYATEADPLFFKAQRGEIAEQEWLDAVEAIRTRYPYPSDSAD